MKFGEKLVELQKEHAETDYRLAKALGVHQTTIRNWREGKMPQLAHRARIAQHYGCAIEDLFGLEED